MNSWRGVLFLRVIVLRIENPYNSLRQIANLSQRVTPLPYLKHARHRLIINGQLLIKNLSTAHDCKSNGTAWNNRWVGIGAQ